MKLLTYLDHVKERVGVLSCCGEWVYPVDTDSMLALIDTADTAKLAEIRALSEKESTEVAGAARLSEVELLAPIPVPKQDLICLGVNYAAHAEESARFHREHFSKSSERQTIYFSKRVDRTVAPYGGICAHEDMTDQLDYEAELAVVLGRDVRGAKQEDVKDCIFGYTIVNDVSARDVQTGHKQFYFGKGLDGFTPMGPFLVTADEIAYPPELRIRSFVNDEPRQDSNTGLLLSSIEDIVVELSQGMTLRAGTIIATGTPAGVGMGFTPPKFLAVGDKVVCSIEGIGTIENRVVSTDEYYKNRNKYKQQ